MIRLLLLFLLGICPSLLFAKTLTETDYIRCVQRNLELMGFDPRGVDGFIGKGTLSAAEKFLSAYPTLQLDALSKETSKDWCVKANDLFPDKLMLTPIIISNYTNLKKVNVRVYTGQAGRKRIFPKDISQQNSRQITKDTYEMDSLISRSLVEQASYICVEAIVDKSVELSLPLSSSSNKYKVDGITNTNPYFSGYCRFASSGSIFKAYPKLFEIQEGYVSFRFPIK